MTTGEASLASTSYKYKQNHTLAFQIFNKKNYPAFDNAFDNAFARSTQPAEMLQNTL